MITKERKEELSSMTVRDKALLVIHGYIDKEMTRVPRTISEEEKEFIVKSLNSQDLPKYHGYLKYYFSYVNIITRFSGYSGEFSSQANKLIGLIRLWKEYQKEEALFNATCELLKNDEALRVKYLKQLTSLKFEDAVLKVTTTGIQIDSQPLYSCIKKTVKDLTFAIALEKSFVLVIEEYARKTRSKAFMPKEFLKEIQKLKKDLSFMVGKEYSLKELHKAEKKGKTITEKQRHMAVIPYYEDVAADDDFLDYWSTEIKSLTNGNIDL